MSATFAFHVRRGINFMPRMAASPAGGGSKEGDG